MEYIDKIKKMLCEELDEYGSKKSLSAQDVEMVHKLTDTIKNIDKIDMLEGEGDEGYSGRYSRRSGYYRDGSSYDGSYYGDRSYARGRGSNARRDSMGRYASDGGEGGGMSNRSYRGYSRHDAKDMIMSKLGEMMEDANPDDREVLKKYMRKIEED